MKSQLTKRVLVAAAGVPAILLTIRLGGIWFAVFIASAILLALREFYIINAEQGVRPQIWLGLIVSVGISIGYYQPASPDTGMIIAGAIIIIMTVMIIELFRNIPKPTANISLTLSGILYIPVLLGTLIYIRNWDDINNTNLTWGIFLSIWICDTAAYFAGKQWGDKKVLKRVSPNKTIVGSVAGLIGSGIVFSVMLISGLLGTKFSWIDVLAFTIISGIFGQIGDFAESLIKRDMKVKDSSSFLPGHGGVLDRFDSLLFAAPLTFLYIKLFLG